MSLSFTASHKHHNVPDFLPTNPKGFQSQVLKYLFRNMRGVLSWWHIFIQISQLVLLSNFFIWTLLTTSCFWDYHWSLHWSQFIICYSYQMILGWYKQETPDADDKYENAFKISVEIPVRKRRLRICKDECTGNSKRM